MTYFCPVFSQKWGFSPIYRHIAPAIYKKIVPRVTIPPKGSKTRFNMGWYKYTTPSRKWHTGKNRATHGKNKTAENISRGDPSKKRKAPNFGGLFYSSIYIAFNLPLKYRLSLFVGSP